MRTVVQTESRETLERESWRIETMGDESESSSSINMMKKVEKSRLRRVCVFCGSSTGKRICYQDAAVELGKELVARKMDLVYGGGSAGLMGLVSAAVHGGGGHVIGIMPTALMVKEITGEMRGEVKAVSGMHQRKAEMARHSDAFIALPGGYGTLEELLEVISWAQLGIHKKPVGLLNVDGYYNSLLAFIDKAVDDGFIKSFHRNIIISAPNAKGLVQKLEDYVPVQDVAAEELRWEREQVGYNSALHTELASCGWGGQRNLKHLLIFGMIVYLGQSALI